MTRRCAVPRFQANALVGPAEGPARSWTVQPEARAPGGPQGRRFDPKVLARAFPPGYLPYSCEVTAGDD